MVGEGKTRCCFIMHCLIGETTKSSGEFFSLNRRIIVPNQRATQATLDNWLTQNPYMLIVYRQAQAANNKDIRASRQVQRRARGLST